MEMCSECALLNTSNFWSSDHRVQISLRTHLDILISLHSLVSPLYSFRLYVEKLPVNKNYKEVLEIYKKSNILKVGFHSECGSPKTPEQNTAAHRKATDDDTRRKGGQCYFKSSVQSG